MRYHKLTATSEPGFYMMDSPCVSEDDILLMANQLARQRFAKGRVLNNPQAVREHIRTLLQHYEHEVFVVVLLDGQLRTMGYHELFRGTIDTANVYPREVVKLALKHNASAMIVAHNHPSGIPTPSQADIQVTKHLTQALALVNVRVLDHIVVGTEGSTSMMERGLM